VLKRWRSWQQDQMLKLKRICKAKARAWQIEKFLPLGEFGRYLLGGLFLSLSFLFIFIQLADELLENELVLFDQVGTGLIRSWDFPHATEVMTGITMLGSAGVTSLIAGLLVLALAARHKYFREATAIVVVLAGAGIMNIMLKYGFQRDRPNIGSLLQVSGYSFPSGHAMIACAFYGLLAYLVWDNRECRRLKYILVPALAVLIAAIGVSRIYLGVHYPSDVVAGLAAGAFWLVLCILGLQAVRHYQEQDRRQKERLGN